MLEKNFQKKVLNFLSRLPNTYYHKHQAGSIAGIPDIIACINGLFIALELKASKSNKPTDLQRYTLAKINHSKGFGLLVYPENFDEISKDLEKLSEGEAYVQTNKQRTA
jgi:hypothetical protein